MTIQERKKASDFAPELLALFDRYQHGGISRREFIRRAGLTGAIIGELVASTGQSLAGFQRTANGNLAGVRTIAIWT